MTRAYYDPVDFFHFSEPGKLKNTLTTMKPNVHDKSSLIATYRVPTVDDKAVQLIDKVLTSVEQSTQGQTSATTSPSPGRQLTVEQSTEKYVALEQSTQSKASSSPTTMGTPSQQNVESPTLSSHEDEALATVDITTDYTSIHVTETEPSSTLAGYARLKDLDQRQTPGLFKFIPIVFLLLLLLLLLLKGTKGNFYQIRIKICKNMCGSHRKKKNRHVGGSPNN